MLIRTGLIFLLGMLSHSGLMATHIVGGQIGYRWVSGNTYEIILDVYRDCSSPANEPFDREAFISIYDLQGGSQGSLSIPYDSTTTQLLDGILYDECLIVPNNVCVQRTRYQATVNLGPNPPGGGYRIAYIRCCRNETIANIVNPLESGAVYDIVLTREAMLRRNSSPRFREWPPIFICINQPIFYSHAAVDSFETAGFSDSLAYRLCEPLSGGSLVNPRPIGNSNPPPYDTIVWNAPTYNLFNMLGNTGDTTLVLSGCTAMDTIISDTLSVHPVTGELFGTPTIQGRFVVGVCVEEYDRTSGILLSTTRRDFQYNVGQCIEVTSNYEAPTIQCDDFTVEFTSTSTNADDFVWYFDFPEANPTSTLPNPVHTFPDTGNYTVALIVQPLSACIDTFCQNIYLATSTLRADFTADILDCADFAVLALRNLSIDSAVQIVSKMWTITYNGVTITSMEENPVFNVPLGVSGTIRLSVTNANTCIENFEMPFTTGNNDPGELLIPDLFACLGDTVGLNPSFTNNTDFSFLWSPASGLLDPANVINPRVAVTGDATYNVTISAANGLCEIPFAVNVHAVPLPELDFEVTTNCDGLTLNFNNTSTNATGFLWNFGDPQNPNAGSLLTNPSYTYPDTGNYTIRLAVQDTALCQDSITRVINIPEKLLSAEFSVSYTSCTPDSARVRFNDLSVSSDSDITDWFWDFGNGQTSTLQNPEITMFSSTTLTVTLTITDNNGCTNTMTKQVIVNLIERSDFDALPNLLIHCEGTATQLPTPLPDGYFYRWSPTTGIDDPTAANPTFSPTQSTTYTLTIGIAGADTCFYTLPLEIQFSPAINLSLSGGGLTCEPSSTLTATTSTPAAIVWTNSVGTVLSNQYELTIPVSGISTYTATATDSLGCTSSQQITVSGGPVNVTIPELVAVCLGESLDIIVTNDDPNDIISLAWSPLSAFEPGTQNSFLPNYIETVGERTVYVEISNQFGCSLTDSVRTAVIDTSFQLSFTSVVQCDGRTFEFTNTSTNAFAYVWDFGDGNTSTDINPIHTYQQTGTYQVSLTMGYAVSCMDTVTATVTATDPVVDAQFDYDITNCINGSAEITFTDASINTFNNTIGWRWIFSNGQESTLQNPVITVNQNGPLGVTFIIFTENNCTDTATATINIQLVNVSIADTILVCPGDSVPLNPGGNISYQYLWTPATGLSNPAVANPLAFPDQTTTYTVLIKAIGTDTCSYTQEVTVLVPETIVLTIPQDTTTCGGAITLNASANVPVSIVWTNASGTPLGGPSITVDPMNSEIFTAMATDTLGCMVTDSLVVTDNGVDAQISPSGNVTACEDLPFQVTVSNLDPQDNLTYTWTPAGLIVSGQGTATPTVMVGPNGATVSVSLSNQFGCRDTLSVVVDIVPFTISVADTVFICAGEPRGITPGLNPNYQYVWSPTTDLDFSLNISNPIYTGTTGAVYSVTVTDESGGFFCQTDRTITVVVTPEIDLSNSGDTTVCQLGDVTLQASTAVPVSFEWSGPDGTVFASGSPAVLTADLPGNYPVQLIVTDGFGCQDTAQINVAVTDFQPGSLQALQTLCTNTPIPLNPDGNPAYVYQWSPATGLDDPSAHNPVAVILEPITYSVTVTDPISGCQVSTSIQADVYTPLNLIASSDTTICVLGDLVLTANTDIPAVINWYEAGNDVPEFTGSPYTYTIDAAGTFTFIAIAVDANGCSDTVSVNVLAANFQPGPLLPVQTLCDNTPTPLNPGGNPAYLYQWSPATGLSQDNAPNPLAVVNAPITYQVTVTDPASGCTLSSQIAVSVFPAIQVETNADTLLCEIVPITLSATSSVPTTFSWHQQVIGNTIGQDASIQVTPSEGVTNYIVIAEDVNGCTDTATVNVTIFVLNSGIQDTLDVCSDTPTPINPDGNPAYTYVWTPTDDLDLSQPHNPVITTTVNRTYQATVTDANLGCNITRTIHVQVFPVIDLEADATIAVCEPGAQALLTATSLIPSTFEWSTNPDFIPVLGTGDTLSTRPIAGTSTYYVRATDSNGCTETRTVTVNNYPIAATITPPLIICAPQTTASIGVVNLAPNQQLVYNWQPDNAVAPASGSPVVTVNAALAENFSVVLTNQFGCIDTLNTSVTILDLAALVTLNIDPEEIILGESAQLEVNGCDNCAYKWSPSETLSDPDIRNPLATPEQTTEYTVTVGRDGCSVVLRGTVVVNYICEEPYIFFPSAFTPNGDGENDVLRVRARPALVLEVSWSVYNRWGQKVFEANDLNDAWDGTFKGQELSPDVYGYHLTVLCPGGLKFSKHGNVTLLR
jgi:gliding motility-associated-like protein